MATRSSNGRLNMAKLPTDLDVLREIYDSHRATYESFDPEDRTRTTKIMVPIDVAAVALALKSEPDIVFGRLYHHLENKYGYTKSDGSRVALFTPGLAVIVIASIFRCWRRFWRACRRKGIATSGLSGWRLRLW